MQKWMRHAFFVEDFELDIAFQIEEQFVYSPPPDPNRKGPKPKLFEKLYEPKNLVNQQLLASSDPFEELTRYYDSVLLNKKSHQQKLNPFYFRVKPYLFCTRSNKPLIDFLFLDTIPESIQFFESLIPHTTDDRTYFNSYQTCRLEVSQFGDFHYLREYNSDTEESHSESYYFKTEMIKTRSANTLVRAHSIHTELVEHFKKDYWT
ncbi:hypothetical protein [Roseivirga pacifica]|uniref:hypothetical protein n=1 Tax=Roseivirga pacifica TaxID=1267423 RepID=UPI003BAFA798